LNGKQRLQHSQEGDVIVHYEQKHEHDGSILIEAKKSHKDLVKPADKKTKKKKEMQTHKERNSTWY